MRLIVVLLDMRDELCIVRRMWSAVVHGVDRGLLAAWTWAPSTRAPGTPSISTAPTARHAVSAHLSVSVDD